VLSDAYNNVSGTIDALVYVVTYGCIGGLIWLGFRTLNKSSKTQKRNIPTANKGAEAVRKISTPNSLEDLELPFAKNGYLKDAGWYEDPMGKFSKRYFAGARWTSRVMDASGVEMDETNLPPVAKEPASQQPSPVLSQSSQPLQNSQTMTSDLAALADLFQRGLLTETEFTSAKDKLLR
jgi:hypothetical protein